MTRWSLTLAVSATALAVLPVASPEPSVPFTPRATIAHYNGSGVNVPLWDLTNGDVPAAVTGSNCPIPAAFGPTTGNADNAKTVAGQTWGPILNLGTCVTNVGNAAIRLRPFCLNGPSVTLPGGCGTGQILHTGTLLGTIVAPHNGVVCNVPNQPVPPSAVGLRWAAQATVREFGSVRIELSSLLVGNIDVCF